MVKSLSSKAAVCTSVALLASVHQGEAQLTALKRIRKENQNGSIKRNLRKQSNEFGRASPIQKRQLDAMSAPLEPAEFSMRKLWSPPTPELEPAGFSMPGLDEAGFSMPGRRELFGSMPLDEAAFSMPDRRQLDGFSYPELEESDFSMPLEEAEFSMLLEENAFSLLLEEAEFSMPLTSEKNSKVETTDVEEMAEEEMPQAKEALDNGAVSMAALYSVPALASLFFVMFQ